MARYLETAGMRINIFTVQEFSMCRECKTISIPLPLSILLLYVTVGHSISFGYVTITTLD